MDKRRTDANGSLVAERDLGQALELEPLSGRNGNALADCDSGTPAGGQAQTDVYYVAAPNLAQGAFKLRELGEADFHEKWIEWAAGRPVQPAPEGWPFGRDNDGKPSRGAYRRRRRA